MITLFSDAVQTAIYERLSSDSDLTEIIGTQLYDAVPSGPVPDLYVLIGEESVTDASDKTAFGAMHEVTVSVLSISESFLAMKRAATAIATALDDPALELSRGRVCALWFLDSTSKRNTSGQRRIDLKFRLRVEA